MNYEVKVDHSPIYELMSSFLIYATRKWIEDLDAGVRWAEGVSKQIDNDFAEKIAESRTWPFADYDILLLWVVIRDKNMNIESFLSHLAHCSAESLLGQTLPYAKHMTEEEVERIRDGYIPLLQAWNEQYFRNVDAVISPLLEEDAAEKQILVHKMEPMDLVEYATNGVVLEPDEAIQTVLILPVIHSRPLNYYCQHDGLMIIQYAIDLPETDEGKPPIGLTRFTRALNDESRLRILRYLAEDLRTLSEIVELMGLSEDTIHYHMRNLRAAGLLRTHLKGKAERFSIRADGVAEMQLFLESYLSLS